MWRLLFGDWKSPAFGSRIGNPDQRLEAALAMREMGVNRALADAGRNNKNGAATVVGNPDSYRDTSNGGWKMWCVMQGANMAVRRLLLVPRSK